MSEISAEGLVTVVSVACNAGSSIEAELKKAFGLHRCGQLAQAEKLYRACLLIAPDNFDAQHLLGVLLHQSGRNVEALELICAALQRKPNNVEALSNYGAVLGALNRFDQALASLDKAIALQPGYAQAFYNRGAVLQSLKRFDGALENYDKAITLKPDCAQIFNNRGIVLRELNRINEVLASYDKAISLKPNFAEAHNNRGNALKELGRFDEALASYERAIALRPNYADAFNNRGNALTELKFYNEALASFDKAISLVPSFAEAFNNRGIVFQKLGRFDEALTCYDKAIVLKPDNAEAFNNRGNVLKELSRFRDALASYDRAIALKPNNAEAFNNRAIGLMELGQFTEAGRAAEQAVRLAPRKASYYRTLGNVRPYVVNDTRLTAMEELARSDAALAIDDRIELHFALAKAYEDLGKSGKAFDHLLEGNGLKRQQISYNEAKSLGAMDQARAAFTAELFQARRYAGNLSSIPVFIVGMPRSGSTLVEQILASHPEVFGAGELRNFRKVAEEYLMKLESSASPVAPLSAMTDGDFSEIGTRYVAEIKRLAPGATRITDKMTGNFILAGLIHLALPNAPIIHTLRDPLDTCISCFSKLFGEGELNFTYNLAELARYYRNYSSLMNHWRHSLPPRRILDVRYEDVVADLEGQSRRIVEFCGLGWDSRCLEFHNTKRPVRTLSATQVRRPIYKTAIGRGRVYGPLLTALLNELEVANS